MRWFGKQHSNGQIECPQSPTGYHQWNQYSTTRNGKTTWHRNCETSGCDVVEDLPNYDK